MWSHPDWICWFAAVLWVCRLLLQGFDLLAVLGIAVVGGYDSCKTVFLAVDVLYLDAVVSVGSCG